MSNIQQIDSAPEYIKNFIHLNSEQLFKIYEEGMTNNSDLDKGILCLQCSQENNKMDVQFMNDTMMCEIIEKDSYMNLKNNIPENKKLFFVQDLDINSVFLIYI